MDREHDIVDLGAASVETQGLRPGVGDDIQGQKATGLSDD